MTDISLNGVISVPTSIRDQFLKDFNDFLVMHDSDFRGSIRYHEFDDCEIIEENEEVSD